MIQVLFQPSPPHEVLEELGEQEEGVLHSSWRKDIHHKLLYTQVFILGKCMMCGFPTPRICVLLHSTGTSSQGMGGGVITLPLALPPLWLRGHFLLPLAEYERPPSPVKAWSRSWHTP